MTNPPPDPLMLEVVDQIRRCHGARVNSLITAFHRAIVADECSDVQALWSLVSVLVAIIRSYDDGKLEVLQRVQHMISFAMAAGEKRDAEAERAAKPH